MMPPSETNNSNGLPPIAESGRGALVPQPMFPPPVSGTFTPPALATMPDAATLLKALRRRLVPALFVGLIFAAIVGSSIWYLFPPPKIAARCQLYISPIPQQLLFKEDRATGNEWFRSTQAYLVKDRFTLNAALNDHKELAELSLIKEQEDPLQWLENEIKVSFPSPEMMHISLSGNRPEEQQKIVLAVTSSYLAMWVNRQQAESSARQKSLEKIRQEMEKRALSKRQALRTLQRNAGAFGEEGMAILQVMALQDLDSVKRDLTNVRGQLRTLLVDLGMQPDWLEQVWPHYAAALNSLPGPGLPINHAVVCLLHDDFLVAMSSSPSTAHQLEEMIDQNPEVAKAMKKIQEQQQLIARIGHAVKGEQLRIRLRKANAELDSFKKAEKTLRDKLRPDLLARHRRHLLSVGQSDRTNNRKTYQRLKTLERVLDVEVQRLHEKSTVVKNQAVDLETLKDEVEHSEKFTKRASEELMIMEVEKEAPPRVQQREKEAVLFKPDETKKKIMVIAGGAIGALGLVLLAFAWFEFQSRKVHTADEVVHGLGLNLVGTVPDASPRGWLPWSGGGINAVYTQSMLTESVDSARTQLLHIARQEKLQIVMITSALAGEGKTSLASHLAASLARSGRRTIIVDSDLRNPTMHRLFERSRAPGVSELLRGEADLAEVSRDTSIPNLWLISAGKADTVALQALAFDAIPKLFEELRLRYDFIIVDSCPVLPVADSLLVGQHVDGVVFSLLRQVSRMPRVYAAYQRLSMLGIRMLGAVVNGTSHDLYPADYNYVASEGD